MSQRERLLHRIEERNDQTLIGLTVLCIGTGFFFGALTGGTWPAIAYGLVGAIIGMPAAFIVNLSRRWFG